MQTRRAWGQEDLFVAGPLADLVPADHVLRRIDAVLELGWLHAEVRDAYCQEHGRPSIDPESALRLMVAGFVEGVVHDRALMRRAQTDLALRWFAGYRLDEALPDHSSLTRIRQRWGAPRFKRVFQRVVADCVRAGLVKGDVVHVDATLIRADVSWESLTTQHAERVIEAHAAPQDEAARTQDPPSPSAPGGTAPKPKKRSTTDPEASMATSNHGHHLEPSYKQHTAVDDHAGVIVDVAVETGEANEGKQLLAQIARIEENTGLAVHRVTADSGYAHAANYAALEETQRTAIIPPQRSGTRAAGMQRIPMRRFKYDPHRDRVTCPAGRHLERKGQAAAQNGHHYRARACDCQSCPCAIAASPPAPRPAPSSSSRTTPPCSAHAADISVAGTKPPAHSTADIAGSSRVPTAARRVITACAAPCAAALPTYTSNPAWPPPP
jgi:transposase